MEQKNDAFHGKTVEGEVVRVEPEQVWGDMRPGYEGRTFKVVETYPNGALCEVLTDRHNIVSPQKGRRFLALAARFHPTPTGYRMVQPAPAKEG